jgi:hypothetical protein
MKIRQSLPIILLLSLVFVVSNIFAQDSGTQDEGAHAQIMKMIEKLDNAYKARDTQTYIGYFSVRYSDELDGGRTYAELLRKIEEDFKNIYNITLTREDLNIDAKLNNDSATVTSRVTIKWEEGDDRIRKFNSFNEKMRLQWLGGNQWQIESRQFSDFQTATPGLILYRLSRSMLFWTFIVIVLIVFLLYYKSRKQLLDKLKR